MRSLVVVRCCIIVCLVAQIGPRICISDKGRHDADEVQLFYGDGCRAGLWSSTGTCTCT